MGDGEYTEGLLPSWWFRFLQRGMVNSQVLQPFQETLQPAALFAERGAFGAERDDISGGLTVPRNAGLCYILSSFSLFSLLFIASLFPPGLYRLKSPVL